MLDPPHAGDDDARRAHRVDGRLLSALLYRGHEVAFLVDASGTVVFVPELEAPPLGYRPDESVGRSAFFFVHPDDVAKARTVLAAAIATEAPQPPVVLRGLAKDGTWRMLEIAVTNMLSNPVVGGLLVNMRDVTERVAMEEALRAGEALYRSILETAVEGIWLIDRTGQTLFANESMAGMLGRKLAELTTTNVFEVIPPEAHDEARRRLANRHLVGHEIYELPFVAADGEPRLASVSASPLFVAGKYVGSLCMVSDITDRKRAELELQRRALYDDVTGLPNRTLLQDRLSQALRQRTSSQSIGLLFIDLDDFKAVNDSYGHQAGDVVLREIAQRLASVVREGDTLARLAGDEFVVVCPDIEGELEADALSQRILAAIARPIAVAGTHVTVDASIGIALHEAPRDGEQLVRDADVAMLQAKRQGRGRHVMFDAHVARKSRYHLEDVRQLRLGLDRGEVEVFYQPQVDLEAGSICSVEALARWRHPSRGLLRPSQFIDLAEASGVIVQLGRYVLRAACMQAARWSRQLPRALPIAVNVSARQLDDTELANTVRDALQGSELPPELLALEITETALMSDPDRALRVLTDLRDQGIRIAIDDFGTGYSSLSHLKRLPVDEIKIDREFVDGVDVEGDDRSIVDAVVSMAKALDLRVVGEGVETEAQADALQAIGCNVVQGFLFGHPAPAEQITEAMTMAPPEGDVRSSHSKGP